jgi:hypothetical protein
MKPYVKIYQPELRLDAKGELRLHGVATGHPGLGDGIVTTSPVRFIRRSYIDGSWGWVAETRNTLYRLCIYLGRQ